MVIEKEILKRARKMAEDGTLNIYLLALKNSGNNNLIEVIKKDRKIIELTKKRSQPKKMSEGLQVMVSNHKVEGSVSRFHKKQAIEVRRARKGKRSRSY